MNVICLFAGMLINPVPFTAPVNKLLGNNTIAELVLITILLIAAWIVFKDVASVSPSLESFPFTLSQ
jgi:hypothetical protein